MPRAMVFLSFVEMHKYIADHLEIRWPIERYKTVHYRQKDGLRLWAIHGMANGYDQAVWTTSGWRDIDDYVDMYDYEYWETPVRGEPYKVYAVDTQIINFTIVD